MTLKEYKEKYKMTNQELSRRLGFSHASILSWVKGQRVPHTCNRVKIQKKTKGEIKATEWNLQITSL